MSTGATGTKRGADPSGLSRPQAGAAKTRERCVRRRTKGRKNGRTEKNQRIKTMLGCQNLARIPLLLRNPRFADKPYLGAYLSADWEHRLPEDKGARCVRYFGHWSANRRQDRERR